MTERVSTPFADQAARLRSRGDYLAALLLEKHSGEARHHRLAKYGVREPAVRLDDITGFARYWEIADRKGDKYYHSGWGEPVGVVADGLWLWPREAA